MKDQKAKTIRKKRKGMVIFIRRRKGTEQRTMLSKKNGSFQEQKFRERNKKRKRREHDGHTALAKPMKDS